MRAAADCLLLKDLTQLLTSARPAEEAATELLNRKDLGGDFFPQLPSPKSHFVFHRAKDCAASVTIELVNEEGAGEALPPNRTYHLPSVGRDWLRDTEVWLAEEESIPGNYGTCSYVRIERSSGIRLRIRDRKFLGRCA